MAVCVVVIGAGTLFAQVTATYLYTLANFGGKLPYDWARVFVDQEREETYVVYQNLVRVFNGAGMEVFRFGDDLDVGGLADLTVDGHGDIILLSYKGTRPLVTRCDFRGVPVAPIEIANLPTTSAFGPNRMIYQAGRFYFASTSQGSIIITDANGAFLDSINLAALLDITEKQKSDTEVVGLSVDKEGNILFTVPTLFKAFKLSPEKELTSFGRPGSAPGRFGIISGITSDSRGNIIVLDKLKCVVMVFDKHFNFITEFGRRGLRPGNLILPDDVVIDKRDRLFVTQGRRRGISVFALTSE